MKTTILRKPAYIVLFASIFVSAIYITWLVGVKAGMNPTTMGLQFLSSIPVEYILASLGACFAFSFYILRQKRPKMAVGFQSPLIEMEPDPPALPERAGLEGILERALIQGLSADLNFTLKLPTDTKLNLLGEEWNVEGATITISKKKEEKLAPPSLGLEEEPLQ